MESPPPDNHHQSTGLQTQPEILRVIFNVQKHQVGHPEVTCSPSLDQEAGWRTVLYSFTPLYPKIPPLPPARKSVDAGELKEKKISTDYCRTVGVRELTFTTSHTRQTLYRVRGTGLQPDWRCPDPSSAICWKKQGWCWAWNPCPSNSRAWYPITSSSSPVGFNSYILHQSRDAN